jgi:dihydrofolate reductase
MAAYWTTSQEPYAPPMNEIPKVVFSNTLRAAPWGETRIASGQLVDEIACLKREPGKDLLAHGGVGLARSLVASGLIDEYRLVVHPVALGAGRSPFSALTAPIRLRLHDAVTFKTGVIARTLRPIEPAGIEGGTQAERETTT